MRATGQYVAATIQDASPRCDGDEQAGQEDVPCFLVQGLQCHADREPEHESEYELSHDVSLLQQCVTDVDDPRNTEG